MVNLANPVQILGAGSQDQVESRLVQSAPEDITQYLPIIVKNFPVTTIFGAEIETLNSWKVDQLAAANFFWIRNYSISWAEIEPSPGNYQWGGVNEADLQEISAQNMKLIATIKYTPLWAQKYPGVACGPIAQGALDEFVQFMRLLVQRYGAPPYNIKYWEIGNEPDVDIAIGGDSPFGCWGEPTDTYFGGGYYGQMLSLVYPAIKAVDPSAKVLIGGLLLDCDPANPPPGKDCKPAKFLEGILQSNNYTGGQFFDIVSFHGYVRYVNGVVTEETETNWLARGGPVNGKVAFLREVMAAYGVSKPIMLTEASLMCISPDCSSTNPVFNEIQADYAVELYARTWAMDLLATIWFEFEGPGWRYTGLFNNTTPKPVYHAIDFMSHYLAGAVIGPEVTQYLGIKGYEFTSLHKRILLLWSADGTNRAITLPPNVIQVLDKYGNTITPQAGVVTVNSPIYIEISY
jgi:hypothetical protein